MSCQRAPIQSLVALAVIGAIIILGLGSLWALPELQWVRFTGAELLATPGGQTVAVLARATAVQVIQSDGGWREVEVQGWVPARYLGVVDSLSEPPVCEVVKRGGLYDAPWTSTWGSAAEDFGTEMGRVAKGTTLACMSRELTTTQVVLRGWMRHESLTASADSILSSELCESVSLVAVADSTRCYGTIRWDLSHSWTRRYRLILYDHSGARLFVRLFEVRGSDAPSAESRRVPFDLMVPVPRESIATYRIATPGAGLSGFSR